MTTPEFLKQFDVINDWEHSMKLRPDKQEMESRQGVALIVVLGFLSIMVMMAVAFLTQARVERLVAGAAMEGMRTRQMAQTAMAAAMQDYLNALMAVPQSDSTHDIFLSGDSPGSISHYYSGDNLGDDRLLIGKVEDWLSDRRLEEAMGGGEPEDDIRRAEWIWVRETPGQRSRILGRYAYACLDMSGMIDANLLGSEYGDDVPEYGAATNRNNVRKMVMDAISATPKKGGDKQLKLGRHQRSWLGFDTPAALRLLTDGRFKDNNDDKINAWLGVDIDEPAVGGVDVSALSAYSYSALHREDGGGKKKIPCTTDNIKKEPEFSKLGGASPADVERALQDYESTDVVPVGVDYPSVKNVPMFNEIGFQLSLERGDEYADPVSGTLTADYTLILRLKPEFWYPFPSKDNERTETFTVTPPPSIGCGGALMGAGDIWVRAALGPPASGGTVGVSAGGVLGLTPASLEVEAKFNAGNPYFGNAPDGNIEYRVRLAPAAAGGDPLPPNLNLFVRLVRLNNDALKVQLGSPVDAMPIAGQGLELIDELNHGDETDWFSLEVSDPRLNHDEDLWDVSDPHTLGAINSSVAEAKSAVPGVPPGDYLYCRNGPIQFPGELGYIPNGSPWGSLDIFNTDGLALMNRLITEETVLEKLNQYSAYFTNGTINPYTQYTNVLNAAFYGLDVREVPGMEDEPEEEERLTGSDLENLVGAILTLENKNGRAGWAQVLSGNSLPPGLNKNKRIAIFNNTWGLFNESDRLFVAVVVAQSIKEGETPDGPGNWNEDEDMITGERRAVAFCWIDGSSDVGGATLSREMNVVAFQYLNE